MEALLFDFGGTLDSDGATWIARFLRIYESLGLSVPRPRFERAFYDSDDNLPARFKLKGLSLEQTLNLQVRGVIEALAPERLCDAGVFVDRFLAESRAAFRRNLPVLQRLSRRYRLGIVSNFYGNLDSVLASEGLRDLFSSVADSGALGVTKPDPAIFQKALADLNIAPEAAFMIGDSIPRDMLGAQTLGMRHILVGDVSLPPCCAAALRVKSVADLESVLPPCEKNRAPLRDAPNGKGKRPSVRHRAPLRAGIIAAGDGVRLKSSHPETIKPLVPVRGRPLCHWIVGSLQQAGIDDFTVLFNSRGRRAQESLSAAFPSLRWTFLEKDTASSWESFRLVAGSLAQNQEDFLISTVDALIPSAEARRFADAARRAGAPAALALTRFVNDEKPLWADLSQEGRITALGSRARCRSYVTCGLYYLTAKTAQAMPPAGAYGRLRDYLQYLVEEGRTAGIVLSKTLDVDRPEDIRQAENFVSAFTY